MVSSSPGTESTALSESPSDSAVEWCTCVARCNNFRRVVLDLSLGAMLPDGRTCQRWRRTSLFCRALVERALHARQDDMSDTQAVKANFMSVTQVYGMAT